MIDNRLASMYMSREKEDLKAAKHLLMKLMVYLLARMQMPWYGGVADSEMAKSLRGGGKSREGNDFHFSSCPPAEYRNAEPPHCPQRSLLPRVNLPRPVFR